MHRAPSSDHLGLVIGLIALGILSRLVPHPWNATPTMAIALFAGTFLAKRWALVIPLVIVAASDFLIGWHRTVPFTWAAFVLVGMLGWWLRSGRVSGGRIFSGALTGAVLFFLISNFGVWAVGALYPRTAAGLWECYVAAIPFFRNALMGTLIYTALFFGSFHLFTTASAARVSVRSR